MALKLLNPGLRPLGQFDLDGDALALDGGEYVELQVDNVGAIEGYAADVGALVGANGGIVNFTPTQASVGSLGGLADEGSDEYGTLFGSQIGGTTGRQTQFGAGGGTAVVMGPRTDAASGKVTVWHQPGLYGVTGGQIETDHGNGPIGANTALTAMPAQANGAASPLAGDLTQGGGGGTVAIYVAPTNDTSLVSTTSRAVGGPAILEFHAVYFLGNAF